VSDFSVDIEVKRKDLIHDEFLGHYTLDIRNFAPQKQVDYWYTLRPKKVEDRVTGEIHLRVTVEVGGKFVVV
jgi:hypothetical protein